MLSSVLKSRRAIALPGGSIDKTRGWECSWHTMNPLLVTAAALTVFVGLVHTVLGEKLIIGPLLKKPLPTIRGSEFIVRRTIRFAWHATTIAWWGVAAIFWVYASAPLSSQGAIVLRILSATFFLSFLITLIASHGKHFAWTVFLAIAVLSFWVTV